MNKTKKTLISICSIVLIITIIILSFATYDLKRTNNDTSVKSVCNYSIKLINNTTTLFATSIKYRLSLLTKTNKKEFDGIYKTYPLIGEQFATIKNNNYVIDIVNGISGGYSNTYIHHYPISAYPGENSSIWLIAQGNYFYKYFNNKELIIDVINVGSFAYKLKDEYTIKREKFSLNFDLQEEILYITFIYPPNNEKEDIIYVKEYIKK